MNCCLTRTVTRALAIVLILSFVVAAGCSGKHGMNSPRMYGERPIQPDTSILDSRPSGPDVAAIETRMSTLSHHQKQARRSNDKDPDQVPETASASTPAKEIKRTTDSRAVSFGSADIDDSSSAVDDEIWRRFELAEEYYHMGAMANRDASWEEAQYYFEKGMKILAKLDIDSDSLMTPEAVKYNRLLDNFVADYRATLRSLGHLEPGVSPAVIVERFSNMSPDLGSDSVKVFKKENEPTQITYDLPVKMNDRVKKSIVYFQTVARKAFERYLNRMGRYTPMMKEIIAEYDLPQDFIYLSLVESGYNPHAYSWARAMGLWQFISSTGRLYKLDRDWWIDERKDPIKSTHAACQYLRDLHERFGDWELAMAAYNGGPGRVSRMMRKQKTNDFWKLRLKRQTMDYVPLIYAAAIIAKNPEKYGFTDIQLEPEVVWETVEIDRCLEFKTIAKHLGTTEDEIKRLNPELLRNYTPPQVKKYNLKIPVGSKEKFFAALDKMPSPAKTSWVKHKIRRGQTVSHIAARYGVSQYAILQANNLSRRSRIYAGKTLVVPVPLDRSGGGSSSNSNRDYTADGSIYTVRSGDNLWDIARAFGTSVNKLRRSNYIERGSRIYVGQKLKIPSSATKLKSKSKNNTQKTTYAAKGKSSGKSGSGTKYKVRRGDTVWDIARKYGTTTAKIRQLNGLSRSSRIYPGQILTVSGSASGGDYVVHKVRRGETLSRIAQKYRVKMSRIISTNDISDPDELRVGMKLKIYR